MELVISTPTTEQVYKFPSPLLIPERDKYRIAECISKEHQIGILTAHGASFADLMVTCRQLANNYLIISTKPYDDKPPVALSCDAAYKAILSGTIQFFREYGRTTLSVKDLIVDLPAILDDMDLVGHLRQ